MTHHINHDGRVAVAGDVFWMPINASTPRNVKVLAISRERSGVLQVAEIRTDEKWLTHWHPLPRFRMDGDCSSHQANRVAAPKQESETSLNIEIEFDDDEKKTIKVHGTAQNMRYLKVWLDRIWRERAAPPQAQPAKPLESKLVGALLDFDVRGMCAAELLCWHRLTEAESDQLVEFIKIIKEQP